MGEQQIQSQLLDIQRQILELNTQQLEQQTEILELNRRVLELHESRWDRILTYLRWTVTVILGVATVFASMVVQSFTSK